MARLAGHGVRAWRSCKWDDVHGVHVSGGKGMGDVGLPLGFWAIGLHKGDGPGGMAFNWGLIFLGLDNWAQ